MSQDLSLKGQLIQREVHDAISSVLQSHAVGLIHPAYVAFTSLPYGSLYDLKYFRDTTEAVTREVLVIALSRKTCLSIY